MDHSTVVCLVAWSLNEREARVDLVLIEISLLFLCKFLLISMKAASLAYEKQGVFYQNKGCLPFTKTIQLEISGINMKQLNAMLRETESL